MPLPVWEAGTLYPTGSVVQPLSASPAISTTIPNAGFEDGDTGWAKGTGWAINTTRHFTGAYGAEFSGTGPANLDSTTPIAVNPGQSITCTLAVDQGAAASGDAGARVALVWYDAGMVLLSVSEGTLVDSGSDGTWKTSTVTAVAPINAAFVVPRAIAFSDGAESIWVDAFAWNYVSPPTTAGLIFKAVQPATGASGATEPVWPTVNGAQVIDNEVIWEAMLGTRVVWEAHPILESGTVEPAWPLLPDAIVADEGIRWRAFPRVITDEKCPHSPVVLIMEGHVFSPDDDVVRFSAALAPRDWSTVSDAGYLNTGLSTIASVKGTALAPYRKNMTTWTASGFQLFQMDPDPELMIGLDAMEGIGTVYPKTLVPIVDDLLFLNPMGVRSVNIAVGGNNLGAGDVGAPVDELVRRSIEIAEANGVEPFAAYYPGLGQYMLAFEGQPVDAVVVSGDLGDGFIGEAVTGFAYTSTGGVGPKTYAIGSGALDPGLTLNPDGTVTGSRASSDLYTWTVIATDSEGLESLPHADSAETFPIYWLLGPLEIDGVTGYLRTNDPESWPLAVRSFPHAYGYASCSLNEVNGMLWSYGTSSGDSAYVSSDGGESWRLCNSTFAFPSMLATQGVWWNGAYYFRQHLRSADGETWAEVPNKPEPGFNAYATVAYEFSGTIVMAFTNALGGTLANYRSQDNGETWTDIGVPYGFALWGEFGLERDGGRIWTTNTGDGPAYTDTQFDSFVSNSGIGPGGSYFQRGDFWLGVRGDTIKRVAGNSDAWAVVHTFATSGLNFPNQNRFAETHTGVIYGVERDAGNVLRIIKSADDGQTWSTATTIATSGSSQIASLIRYAGVGG